MASQKRSDGSSSPSLDEKKEKREQSQKSSDDDADVDLGGESSLPPPPTLTEEQERRLWRKIDLRLMPILTLMYLLSFLDRGNIGNARLQGLQSQLHLTGNQYNIALTMFFIPYCIFECPANLVLKKFRPSRWLPGITVLWGVIMTLMGLVKNYHQLVGARVCLGVAEAGLFPGVVYYLLKEICHQFDTLVPPASPAVLSRPFFGAASLAGASSGLPANGISFTSGTHGFLGWSWVSVRQIIYQPTSGKLGSQGPLCYPSNLEKAQDFFRLEVGVQPFAQPFHIVEIQLLVALISAFPILALPDGFSDFGVTDTGGESLSDGVKSSQG